MNRFVLVLLVFSISLVVSCQSGKQDASLQENTLEVEKVDGSLDKIVTPVIDPQSSPVQLAKHSPASPVPTPIQASASVGSLLDIDEIKVNPDKAAIVGIIQANRSSSSDMFPLKVYLSPFVWDETKTRGVFIYNTNGGIFTDLISGQFQFIDIVPGFYVILVGEVEKNAVAITRDDGEAEIFEVKAGEILDIAERDIFLP